MNHFCWLCKYAYLFWATTFTDSLNNNLLLETFWKDKLLHGVQAKKYHADNSIFSAKAFRQILKNMERHVRFSGVGAHHQNKVVERVIQTVVYKARIMLLYAALRWPKMAEVSHWPMAISHAVFLWNNTPNSDTDLSPFEVFWVSSEKVFIIQNQHVWCCQTYILHFTL